MKFELAINMDGKGFRPAHRMSLGHILKDLSREVAHGDNGVVKDWYGEIVGTWAITKSEST